MGEERQSDAVGELAEDKLYWDVKPRKTRARFREFCRYLRSLCSAPPRIAIICGNFSLHLTARRGARFGAWAAASNAEIAYTPTNSSWLTASVRSSQHCGTSHWIALTTPHKEQTSMIRRYII